MTTRPRRRQALERWAAIAGTDQVIPRAFGDLLRPIPGAKVVGGHVIGRFRHARAPLDTQGILPRFLRLGWGAPVAPFVARYGELGVTDEGWPEGWITAAPRRYPYHPGRHGRPGYAERADGEPVAWYQEYARLAAAILECGCRAREGTLAQLAPAAIADLRNFWIRLEGLRLRWDDGPAAVASWCRMAASRVQVVAWVVAPGPATEEERRNALWGEALLALGWWHEAGGVTQTVWSASAPGAPFLAWRGGAWAAVGLALLRAIEGERVTAVCAHCRRPVGDRQRAPKRGQLVWCAAPECQRVRRRASVRKSRARRRGQAAPRPSTAR